MDRSKVPQNSVLLAADDNPTSNLSKKKGSPAYNFAPWWLCRVRYINFQTLDTISNILRRNDLDGDKLTYIAVKEFQVDGTWTSSIAFHRDWNIVSGNMTQIHDGGCFVTTNDRLYLWARDNIATLAICLCLYKLQSQWKEDTQEGSLYICREHKFTIWSMRQDSELMVD